MGRGSGLSVLQLVKAFEEVSGQKVPCEIVGRRAGDIDASYADVSLAKKELEWQATRGVLDMCMYLIFNGVLLVIRHRLSGHQGCV